MDRAVASGATGRRFESCQAYQLFRQLQLYCLLFDINRKGFCTEQTFDRVIHRGGMLTFLQPFRLIGSNIIRRDLIQSLAREESP